MRWEVGIYLGTTMSTNEVNIGISSGNVTRSRAFTRVRADQRWNRELVQKITGTPMHPGPWEEEAAVESFEDPHANLDAAERSRLDDDAPAVQDQVSSRLRITKRDVEKYGVSDNCAKCARYTLGEDPIGGHTEACRQRFYRLMEEADDPKWRTIQSERRVLVEPAAADIAPEDEVEARAVHTDFEVPAELWQNVPEWADKNDDLLDDLFLDTDDEMVDRFDEDPHVDPVDPGMDVDMLVTMGVEPIDAIRFINKLSKSGPVTFHEFYRAWLHQPRGECRLTQSECAWPARVRSCKQARWRRPLGLQSQGRPH